MVSVERDLQDNLVIQSPLPRDKMIHFAMNFLVKCFNKYAYVHPSFIFTYLEIVKLFFKNNLKTEIQVFYLFLVLLLSHFKAV